MKIKSILLLQFNLDKFNMAHLLFKYFDYLPISALMTTRSVRSSFFLIFNFLICSWTPMTSWGWSPMMMTLQLNVLWSSEWNVLWRITRRSQNLLSLHLCYSYSYGVLMTWLGTAIKCCAGFLCRYWCSAFFCSACQLKCSKPFFIASRWNSISPYTCRNQKLDESSSWIVSVGLLPRDAERQTCEVCLRRFNNFNSHISPLLSTSLNLIYLSTLLDNWL